MDFHYEWKVPDLYGNPVLGSCTLKMTALILNVTLSENPDDTTRLASGELVLLKILVKHQQDLTEQVQGMATPYTLL